MLRINNFFYSLAYTFFITLLTTGNVFTMEHHIPALPPTASAIKKSVPTRTTTPSTTTTTTPSTTQRATAPTTLRPPVTYYPTTTTTTTTTNSTPINQNTNVDELINLLNTKSLNEKQELKDKFNTLINIISQNKLLINELKKSPALRITVERGFAEKAKQIIDLFADNEKEAQECIEYQSGHLNRNALMVAICSHRKEIVKNFYQKYSSKIDWIMALQKKDSLGETALIQAVNIPDMRNNNLFDMLYTLFYKEMNTTDDRYLQELKKLLSIRSYENKNAYQIITEKNICQESLKNLYERHQITNEASSSSHNLSANQATIEINENDIFHLYYYLSEGFANSAEAHCILRKILLHPDKSQAISLLSTKDKANKTIIHKCCIRKFVSLVEKILHFFKDNNEIEKFKELSYHKCDKGQTAFILAASKSSYAFSLLLKPFCDYPNGEEDRKVLKDILNQKNTKGETITDIVLKKYHSQNEIHNILEIIYSKINTECSLASAPTHTTTPSTTHATIPTATRTTTPSTTTTTTPSTTTTTTPSTTTTTTPSTTTTTTPSTTQRATAPTTLRPPVTYYPTTTTTTTTTTNSTPINQNTNVDELINLLNSRQLNERPNFKIKFNTLLDTIGNNPFEKKFLKTSPALRITVERGFAEKAKQIIDLFADNEKEAQECIEYQSGPLNRNALMAAICSYKKDIIKTFYQKYSSKIDWVIALQKKDSLGETVLIQIVNIPKPMKNSMNDLLGQLFSIGELFSKGNPAQDTQYHQELKKLLLMKSCENKNAYQIAREKNRISINLINLYNTYQIANEANPNSHNPETGIIEIDENDKFCLDHYLCEGFASSTEALCLLRKFKVYPNKFRAITLLSMQDNKKKGTNRNIINKCCTQGFVNLLEEILNLFKENNKINEFKKLSRHQCDNGQTAFMKAAVKSYRALTFLLEPFYNKEGCKEGCIENPNELQEILKLKDKNGHTALSHAVTNFNSNKFTGQKNEILENIKTLLSADIYPNTEESLWELETILNQKVAPDKVVIDVMKEQTEMVNIVQETYKRICDGIPNATVPTQITTSSITQNPNPPVTHTPTPTTSTTPITHTSIPTTTTRSRPHYKLNQWKDSKLVDIKFREIHKMARRGERVLGPPERAITATTPTITTTTTTPTIATTTTTPTIANPITLGPSIPTAEDLRKAVIKHCRAISKDEKNEALDTIKNIIKFFKDNNDSESLKKLISNEYITEDKTYTPLITAILFRDKKVVSLFKEVYSSIEFLELLQKYKNHHNIFSRLFSRGHKNKNNRQTCKTQKILEILLSPNKEEVIDDQTSYLKELNKFLAKEIESNKNLIELSKNSCCPHLITSFLEEKVLSCLNDIETEDEDSDTETNAAEDEL